MAAKVIDGQGLARRLRESAAEGVRQLSQDGIEVRLDVLMVGDPAAGELFVRSQKNRCEEIGVRHHLHTLPLSATTEQLIERICRLNSDPSVTGIMVSLPLPEGIDTPVIQYAIDPYKDVEGVNPANIGMLFYGSPIIAPCTSLAVWNILRSIDCPIAGQNAVVVGQSRIAGRPITLFLLQEEATVTSCNVRTRDLSKHTREADILVVAAGVPGLIRGEQIKPGAVVIDVGINRVPDPDKPGQTKTVGDVRYDEALDVAGWITPVPGGVGPVTVAILLHSAVEAAKEQHLGQRRIGG